MAKIRVYELAIELGKDNKEMETLIRGLGIEIKGVMSTLDDDQAEAVRRQLQPQAIPQRSGPGPGIPPRVRPRPYVPPQEPAPASQSPSSQSPSSQSSQPPWDALLQRAASANPQERRTAVLDACEALKAALKASGVPGQTMQVLLLATPEHIQLTAKELAQAILANQRRNEVAHKQEAPDVQETTMLVRAFEAVALAARAPGGGQR